MQVLSFKVDLHTLWWVKTIKWKSEKINWWIISLSITDWSSPTDLTKCSYNMLFQLLLVILIQYHIKNYTCKYKRCSQEYLVIFNMQACYAADIAWWYAAVKLDLWKTTVYTKSTRNSRADPFQKRNLMVGTFPKIVLKMLWASLVTGNMGLSACAASTIGSQTCW